MERSPGLYVPALALCIVPSQVAPSKLLKSSGICAIISTFRFLPSLFKSVFKGGTCVQSYIDPVLQRASNDLDFNTTIQNPNALMQKIEELNRQLKTQGTAIEAQGILYGVFEFELNDTASGTLNYRHRMPSRPGQYERVAGNDIQFKDVYDLMVLLSLDYDRTLVINKK